MHNVMPDKASRGSACAAPAQGASNRPIALAIKLATTASMAENDACVV